MRERTAVAHNEFQARNIDERDKVAVNDKTLADADEATVSRLGHSGDTSLYLTYLERQHMLNTIGSDD